MARDEIAIPAGSVTLAGTLETAGDGSALVIFAHGSGSSRHSPRNRSVAQMIRDAGIGTLLFDLLSASEEEIDRQTAHLRFDIALLAERLEAATRWVLARGRGGPSPRVGYFGASTGAAAALIAASRLPRQVHAVVSRGGRPDLAGAALADVAAPTLLVVGERDLQVIELNRIAYEALRCEKELVLVPRATHLFEEPGTLEIAARLATDWFGRHLHEDHGAQSSPRRAASR